MDREGGYLAISRHLQEISFLYLLLVDVFLREEGAFYKSFYYHEKSFN